MSTTDHYLRFTPRRALSLLLRWNAANDAKRQRAMHTSFAVAMSKAWPANSSFAADAVCDYVCKKQIAAHIEEAWHGAMRDVQDARRLRLFAQARHLLTVAQYWRRRCIEAGGRLAAV